MGKIKKLYFLEWASIILAGALFLCLPNMPYGFYILIRYTVMIVGGVWAYQFFKRLISFLRWEKCHWL